MFVDRSNTRCRARFASIIAGTMVMLSGPAAVAQDNDVIMRRGSEPNLVGKVLKVDDAGITLKRHTGAEYFVTWDRVRAVQTEKPVLGIEPRLERATDMWRARTRLERHDARLAEPLFDRLFEHYRGQTNASAYLVAEGVLRCRLARADHVSAVVPALEAIRLRRAGVAPDVFTNLPSVIDEETMLCPDLVPLWADVAALGRAVRELESYDTRGDAHVESLRVLMRTAMLSQLGRDDAEGADTIDIEQLAASAGIALLHDVVQSMHGPGGDRRPETERLLELIDENEAPAWQQGWAFLALGKARLSAEDRATRLQGVVALLNIPAQRTLSRRHYLAGMALAEAARGLESLDDTSGAGRLRDELQRVHPNHPAAVRVVHFASTASDDADASGEDTDE